MYNTLSNKAPLCIVLANSVCNTHRSGIDIVPSRQGRNLIVPCTAAFLRQRKGVAAGAATRTECHVNGHGTTTRRHFPFLRILPFCVLRRRFAFRRVLLYLCSANEEKGLCGALFSCPKGTSTVWATVFSVAQTVKTVAQIVSSPWATVKSECETGFIYRPHR